MITEIIITFWFPGELYAKRFKIKANEKYSIASLNDYIERKRKELDCNGLVEINMVSEPKK